MAEESQESQVAEGSKITWAPVRELAEAITKLYSEKKIYELQDGFDDPKKIVNMGKISKKTTRSSDPHAKNCVNHSGYEGFVHLSADYTAPFRLDKLGEDASEATPLALAFEFAYNPDYYVEYLNGSKLPVLTTQYLIRYSLVNGASSEESEDVALPSSALVTALCSDPTSNEYATIENLIESRRDKVKQFWNESKTYETEKTAAGELYVIIKSAGEADCGHIARIAFAGLNSNGNGNSTPPGGTKPAPWLNSYWTGTAGKGIFVTDEPWRSGDDDVPARAITLCGVSWDMKPNSNPSKDGLAPETKGAKGYVPPPVGCCKQFIWPSIGAEGGGGTNSFFSRATFASVVDYADLRYQKPLSQVELEAIRYTTTESEIHEGYFPCYVAEGFPGNKIESYKYISNEKSIVERYQQWFSLGTDLYVRAVPMEFNYSATQKVYLRVPVTIVKILKPKSYQTAIRKRWYDMMYYTLRNITGYKFTKTIGKYQRYRVVGVTWDTSKINPMSMINPALLDESGNPKDSFGSDDEIQSTCGTFNYERWKVLNIGGQKYREGAVDKNKVSPFVGGTEDTIFKYGTELRDASQLWVWDETRLEKINKAKLQNHINHDTLFPELYFERLLCYKNKELYNEKNGGFENPTYKDIDIVDCTLCKYEDMDTRAIKRGTRLLLPWEGGGDNTTCVDDAVINYSTHAYTYNVLKKITEFVADYKGAEDEPRLMKYLEVGYCYCPATIGAKNITFENIELNYREIVNNKVRCITKLFKECILPQIPSYYNTLSKNEKYTVQCEGDNFYVDIDAEVDTDAEGYDINEIEKTAPFGYNAYIWKAIDLGGYVKNLKNIKLKFIHYNPTRTCCTNTPVPLHFNNSVDLELDKTDTCEKKSRPIIDGKGDVVGEQEYIDGNSKEGTRYAHKMMLSNKQLWKEALLKCSNLRHNFHERNESAWTGATMWDRDNDDLSVGEIEIYVAPFASDASAHDYQAKYLGSIQFNREYKDDEDSWCGVLAYYCGTQAPIHSCLPFDKKQEFKTDDSVTTTSDAEEVIEAEIINSNITSEYNETKNYLEANITIPYRLLLDDNTETSEENSEENSAALDIRQKYIILAARASHTRLNSALAESKGVSKRVNITENTYPVAWVKYYSGACRWGRFHTYYKFDYEGNS